MEIGTTKLGQMLAASIYLLPVLPLLIRSVLVIRFWRFMTEDLLDAEREPAEHRSQILALSGFSFTASLGVPAYGAAAEVDVAAPTFFVVLSFLSYFGALNLQAYKFYRWQDQLASGLADTGAFCLLLSIIGMVLLLEPSMLYLGTISVLALVFWGSDVYARMRIWASYFRGRQTYE